MIVKFNLMCVDCKGKIGSVLIDDDAIFISNSRCKDCYEKAKGSIKEWG